MLKAEHFSVALVEDRNDQWFIVGLSSDIQRLSDAGFVERAWDIKLDNGHRPYAVLKKRMNFSINDQPLASYTRKLTADFSSRFKLEFAGEIYDVTKTYLIRRTPAFWSELNIVFADESGVVSELKPQEIYAVYQGCILPAVSGVKFVRLEKGTISKAVFPALF